ncbi:MAG: hypothetical protein LQ348_002247 [Seirophora lacunosa]|nr:MAG: hypothetical protein LQ348_002247 [Seirophora lacunosa]
MGSSAKKKKDKKKDFQKSKLKVGKARPKPANFTDTSFKSKSIVLNQQSLTRTAPSATSQFSHHVSLLTSRTDSQRRDSLSYLTTAISTRPTNAPLQQPVSVLLPKILPLTLDGSHGVRTQLLKLLRTLPTDDMEDHIEQVLLYIRAGITHLAADIRTSAMDTLMWASDFVGNALVSCPGGWVKTLKSLMAAQGWPLEITTSAWSSGKASFGKPGSDAKAMVKSLNALASLLRAGFDDPVRQDLDEGRTGHGFPLVDTALHLGSKKSNGFAHLNLFGPPRDEESQMYEDKEERQEVFQRRFQGSIERGLESAKQEGGEVGRAAAGVQKIIGEGMNDYGALS